MFNDLTHETTDEDIKDEVRNMSIAQRLSEYNAATNKATKKFASSAASFSQTVKALIWLRDELLAQEQHVEPEHVPEHEPEPMVEPSTATQATNNAASAAIARSWQDSDTRNRRSTKNKVRVDGVTYKSVRAAYVALGLPIKEHIKFRALLKQHGEATNHGMHWTVVQKEEEEQ